jgi:hypothetical protein
LNTKETKMASPHHPLSDPFPLGQATVASPQKKKKKKKSLTSYLLFTMAINAALNVSNALSTGVCMAHVFDHLASS